MFLESLYSFDLNERLVDPVFGSHGVLKVFQIQHGFAANFGVVLCRLLDHGSPFELLFRSLHRCSLTL